MDEGPVQRQALNYLCQIFTEQLTDFRPGQHGARFSELKDSIVSAAMDMKCRVLIDQPEAVSALGMKLPMGRVYGGGKVATTTPLYVTPRCGIRSGIYYTLKAAAYATKFVRQVAYGASVAWPPYGLDPAIPVSTDDVPHVSDIMTRHGRAAQSIDLQGGPVRIGLLPDLPGISAYLFRALSTVFVIAVIFWIVTAVRRRRPGFLMRAGIVIVMWTTSIGTAAGAHTLDVWRYLIPAVPMVGLLLSLFAVELAETITCLRRD